MPNFKQLRHSLIKRHQSNLFNFVKGKGNLVLPVSSRDICPRTVGANVSTVEGMDTSPISVEIESQRKIQNLQKKASEGNKKGKAKGKKKKGKKEEAKRVAELIENLRLDSPANSSDEETSEDSDASPSILNVRRIQEQNPSSRRAARAMEFADSISDQKVIQTLNRSHLAAKVKRAKTAQGQSHTEGQISNSTSFRNANDEMFLLDSGAGVNIIGEDIAIDSNIKVYKLKQKHLITEASGNLLNIIGSCDIFVKIPFIKTIKKLECLVLRGNCVDREILVY